MAVLSRNIYDVNYRVQDARIYDASDLAVDFQELTNSSTQPQTTEVKLQYKNSIWMVWDCASLLSGVPTTITAGVPSIVDVGRVEVTKTFEGSLTLSQKMEYPKEEIVEVTQNVTVPPMTRVMVSLVVTQGKCDVLFSYSVRDVMADSTEVTYTADNGFYTGENNYDYKFVTTEI